MPPRNPFKARHQRKIISDLPKTILNRTYDRAKRGIALAHHRDDSAFRTAKSRRLKSLHASKRWAHLSESEKTKAEDEVVAALEAIRQQKKKEHEMEWMEKYEKGEVDDEMEDHDLPTLEARPDEWDGEAVEEEDAEWITDSDVEEEAEEVEMEEEGDDVPYSPMSTEELVDIRRRSGEGWLAKMKALESAAENRAVEWLEFMSASH